ncbi:MAG: hypothetical protein K1X78_06210 [Verrucomicrobiaceae bacterium]|nr:hypothetical protein [Verrucomicrobiaceae bacterium]
MTTHHTLLTLAGFGHFGILLASIQVPSALNWNHELARLPVLLRQLFWVYGVFIVLTITGFGWLTLRHLPALEAGDPLARSLAAFIAVFWALRLAVQIAVFHARPYLTNAWRVLGYHTLTAAFVFFTAVYGWAAFR